MGKIIKKKISPRQKMINLMYVVLMAMLALNVSSDVLKGFVLVDEKLTLSTENSARVNEEVYKRFEQQYQANPTKVKVWYDKAQEVRGMTDSLYTMLEDLKLSIVKKSDGKDADVHNIRNKEDLEAARKQLCDILSNYAGFRKCYVVLVFDGWKTKGNPGQKSQYHNIQVVYTKEGETGDAYIESLVAQIGKNYAVRVATSDALVQLSSMRSGVLRMSARELRLEVDAAHKDMTQHFHK